MKMKRPRVSTLSPVRPAEDDPFARLFENGIEEKPIWADLYDLFRDAISPQKLPPLELTSTPIPAPDRMAVKTNPWAFGSAAAVNAGILAAILLLGLRTTIHSTSGPLLVDRFPIKDITLFAPSRILAGGGGGGGANELTPASAGRLPKQEMMPLAPPTVHVFDNPKLAIDPAIAVPISIKLPDDTSMPNIGLPHSPNVRLASNGPGTRAGIGTGSDGGVGPGAGPGYGPGINGGFNGSVYRAGAGGVSNPIPILTPEAEFSDEARRNKYQGVCEIAIIVDTHGLPQNAHVVRSLGMGLDEKALAAVRQYRFKPARKDGKPVAAMMIVAVDFRLF